MVENRIKYFCFVIHYPANTTHSNTHTHTFLWVPHDSLPRRVTHSTPHAQIILLTYPLTHTHPRPCVSTKRVLVVKLATARRHHRCCCWCVQVQVRNHHNKRKRNKRNRNFAPAHKHSSASSRSSRKLVFSCFFSLTVGNTGLGHLTIAKFKVVSVFFRCTEAGLAGMTYRQHHHPGVPSAGAVVWESAVLAAPTSLAALDLKKGGNSHQYCAILDSFEWHNCTLMIDDNTHTHKVTMMTRCSTTCKVLFFVVIFGRKWIEKSIWQLVFFLFSGSTCESSGKFN